VGVVDWLAGHGQHDIEWRLHFHPSCRVRIDDGNCEAIWNNGSLSFRCDDALEWRLAREEDWAGWYSDKFNGRECTTTIIGKALVELPLKLEHDIHIRVDA
jgi:hypothetical protein